MQKDYAAIKKSLEREIQEHADEYEQLIKDCRQFVTDKDIPIDERVDFFLTFAIGKNDEAELEIEDFKSVDGWELKQLFLPHRLSESSWQPTEIGASTLLLLQTMDQLCGTKGISRDKKIAFYEEILSHYADKIILLLQTVHGRRSESVI